MKVIVAAYAFRPNEGSEQGAAWNLLTRLASFHEMWVITRARHRDAIDKALSGLPIQGLHVIYHDLPKLLALKRLPGGLYLYHYLWHLSLKPIAANLHRERSFDLAHHLTFGSYRYPSGLRAIGIPLIMGPVGGAEKTPIAYWWTLGARGIVGELGRWLSNVWTMVDPFIRASYRRASRVLAVTEITQRQLQRITRAPIEILPQSGVQPGTVANFSRGHSTRRPTRILFVGRLVPWKGAHLALTAFAIAKRERSDLQFKILGTGPLETNLRRTIERRSIPDATLLGRLEHLEDVQDLYAESDIFLFPSLHESGGMAVLEAMSSGLPVICLNLGGPAVSVTPECGIVVSTGSPSTTVRALADAILKLTDEPQTWARMSEAAQVRASDYSWDRKAERLNAIYKSLDRRAK